MLLVPVGVETIAVPIEHVREVAATPAAISLPTAPASVLGLFNLRGRILPLLDLSALLNLGTDLHPEVAIVVDTLLGQVGLGASGVPSTAELGDPVDRTQVPGAVGIYRHKDGLALLLDVNVAVTPARIMGWQA